MNTVLIIVSVCFAGFVHGFTGFGYAMVAMALLPLLMGMPQALFLGALFTLPAAAVLFWRTRKHFVLRDSRTLAAGAVVGTVLGLMLVEHIDPALLVRLLGAILILFSLNELLLSRWWILHVPAHFGFPIGLLSGILGAAFNIGGPPAIIYVYSRPWKREQAVATLQAVFFIYAGLRVILTISKGVATEEMALWCAGAIIPFTVILILGARLAARVSPRRFRQIVLVALIGIGLHYALS